MRCSNGTPVVVVPTISPFSKIVNDETSGCGKRFQFSLLNRKSCVSEIGCMKNDCSAEAPSGSASVLTRSVAHSMRVKNCIALRVLVVSREKNKMNKSYHKHTARESGYLTLLCTTFLSIFKRVNKSYPPLR